MKLSHLTKATLISLFFAGLSMNSFAQTPAFNHGNVSQMHQGEHKKGMFKKMMHKRFKHLAKKLALTPQQQEQIKAIFSEARTAREKYQPTMQAFHQAMKTLLTADNFDEQAIIALRESYQPTFEQLALIKAKSRFDMYALLTPEQKAKWQNMQEQRKQHPPMGE